MKLNVEIGGQQLSLELVEEGSRTYAEIGDRMYELDVSEVEPGVYLIKCENRNYEVMVSAISADGAMTSDVGGDRFEFVFRDPKRLRGMSTASSGSASSANITSAMPGKILSILVEVGAEVKVGDGIVIVEAMKMQNEMRSSKGGVIREIYFSEGDNVKSGDLIAVIE